MNDHYENWLRAKKKLLRAIQEGNIEVTRRILESGFNPNIDEQGHTPLMEAAEKGNPEIVRLLLKHGAAEGINQQRENTDSPLICAAQGGNVETIKLLLENGANILDETRLSEVVGEKAIFWTRMGGHKAAEKFLTKTLKEARKTRRMEGRPAFIAQVKEQEKMIASGTSKKGR